MGNRLFRYSATLLCTMIAAAQPSAPDAVFHTGTRLVELEVVVRDQRIRPPGAGAWFAWVLDSGPPFGPPGVPHVGLAKDDFMLLDEGKPQQISVFRAGSIAAQDQPVPLPAGAVSNRQDSGGQQLKGATAVLIDFLNTDFGCLGYERLGMTRFLRSLGKSDGRISLYSLGETLHLLHDFTGDPQKLQELAAALEQPHAKLPPEIADAIRDYGDLLDLGRDEVHGRITMQALKLIIQHLSAVPGRRNLVWLMHDTSHVPPAVVAMAQQANIVLYPVLVRLTGGELCQGGNLPGADDLAAATGGRAFYDVLDLPFAVQTTEEDTGTAYVLGYYPPEEMLDGKYHRIAVKLNGAKKPAEIHYRPGYLATKVAFRTPPPSLGELFSDPADFSSIGLTGLASPQAEHPGFYDVHVTVDLHDIHLEAKDGRFTGAVDVSVPDPSIKDTAKTGRVAVNFTDKELPEALEKGLRISISGAEPESGAILIVVRDAANGIAGSLRIPVTGP